MSGGGEPLELELDVELVEARPRRRPRRVCPWCGRTVAVRLDGKTRAHRIKSDTPAHCIAPAQLELELVKQLELTLEQRPGPGGGLGSRG